MINIKHISAVALAGLLIGACASGPDKRPPRGGERGGGEASYEGYAAKPIALLFASMDQRQDSEIDGADLRAGIAREWRHLSSAPRVGALEYGAWADVALGSAEALPSFISFDRDLNGELSELEFDDRLRAEFAELDKNSDGVLDRSELIFRIARPSRGDDRSGGAQGRGGQDSGRRPPPR